MQTLYPSFKSLIVAAAAALLVAGQAAAQPSINAGGVVNAASYAPPGLPNAGIAQGSIFVIFGKNLGPATLVQASFPLPTVLAGTSVRVTVGGRDVNCYLIYTSATQVAALLPSATPVGTGTIRVTYNNQTSGAEPITVVQSSFGIFAVSQAGSGPGRITSPDYRDITIMNPARSGEAMILWGTGLGPVDFDETQRAPVRDLRGPGLEVEVLVGGRRAAMPPGIGFAGRAPGWAGLDQINFVVPPGVEGCYVPVVVRVNGIPSNFVSMAISSRGGPCSDPMSFSEEDFAVIGPGKDTRIGYITLNRVDIGLPPGLPISSYKSDDATGSFHKYDYYGMISSRGVSRGLVLGQCVVYTFTGQTFDPDVDVVQPQPLDAGPVLNLSGPRGNKQIPRKSPGYYQANLGGGMPMAGPVQPDYLEPGTYTVDNGSGGADVGPFRATLAIANPVVWNRASVPDVISRSQDLVIRWTGGSGQDNVIIAGVSVRANPTVGAAFTCVERGNAQSFTVPSYVLSALPASQPQSGILYVGSSPLPSTHKFRAPGLDIGYFYYTNFTIKMLTYQ